ncbi:MAG TPA: hypothetical protein VHN59_05220 [Chitinophagaceae bacterium]|nr:hypothetical protein [Chitinophagaceae bacterium]
MKSPDKEVVFQLITQELEKLNTPAFTQEPDKPSSTSDEVLKFVPFPYSDFDKRKKSKSVHLRSKNKIELTNSIFTTNQALCLSIKKQNSKHRI